jgi:hypothetical protein
MVAVVQWTDRAWAKAPKRSALVSQGPLLLSAHQPLLAVDEKATAAKDDRKLGLRKRSHTVALSSLELH